MIPWQRESSISRRIVALALTTAVTAVVLSNAGFLAWEVYQFRHDVLQEIETQATIVAGNAALAVAVRDERGARDVLEGLDRSPRITAACLYSADAQLFLAFERRGNSCPPAPIDPTPFAWDRAAWVEPLDNKGELAGHLYVRRELSDLHQRVRVGAGTLLGLLILSMGVAFLIAARMQRTIASPLLDLAETARTVSGTGGHSPRAVPSTSDEIGVVVHAFNDMLDRIDQRTLELSQANADLEREVAERRRVEAERTAALGRERDANRLKDEFLATLSHELRTPLNAVLGWSRVLRTTQMEAAMQARALESIERNARAQARLIEDLLEVSRIVTGKLRLRVQEVDLSAVIDAAIEVVQPAAAAKRQRLVCSIAQRPAMTAGDADRLQQVVWNLLSNAVKFTPPEGCVTVTLDREDGYVIRVTDTGPGIDPRFLPHVFEPFRQADATASREHGGLGLGLAIAKRLAELHGGTVRAHASPGEGTTMEVYLPSVLDAAQTAATAAPPAAADAPPDAAVAARSRPLDGLRVLVVDDEEDARVLLQTLLTADGAEVRTAASVSDALAAIDRETPDVLLSDIGMPSADGYSLLRQLRARPAARGGAVPAVAITAYASARDRRDAAAAGYQAHIAKPFEPADVTRVVAQLGTVAGARPRA